MKESKLKFRYYIAVALVALFFGNFYFSLWTGKSRMREVCGMIHSGMTFEQLASFADKHGLSSPKPNSEFNYLGETKTMGRFACKVTYVGGVVKSSEFNFAD